MRTLKLMSLLLSVSLISAPSFAGVQYSKGTGSGFSAVDAGSVKGSCGEDFIFRSEHQDQVDGYLSVAITKASLSNKVIEDLETAVRKAKSTSKCIWYTAEESGSVK